GKVQEALRAVGTADEAFSHARPGEDPPWMASYTEARHLGFSGTALRELGMHGQFVAETRNRMSSAIANHSEGRARTSSQTRLASLIMVTGDPLEAAALGTQALDGAGLLRSQRTTQHLRELRHLSEPHAHLPEIADLRHRIGTTLTA
ncbi:MAG: XRE family transcriptional regulator, partial [Pseudonocardiaceae bacterium]